MKTTKELEKEVMAERETFIEESAKRAINTSLNCIKTLEKDLKSYEVRLKYQLECHDELLAKTPEEIVGDSEEG